MSIIRTITSWRPDPPIYYGWLVLGTAALGAFAASGIAQIVLAGVQGLILEDMGWERGTIAYAVTAGTWMSGLLTPFVGRMADRHGPRGMMPVATIIVGICLFVLAGTQAVWHFYAAYIVARTIANPILVGVVPQTVAVNFFQRKRNLALGFTSSARPISGAINIQIITLIAQAYSWRAGYRFIGGFALALTVPLFVIMRRRPEDIGLRPDGDTGTLSGGTPGQRHPTTPAHPSAGPQAFEWRPGEAALTPTFWLIVAAGGLETLTSGALSFQAVLFLRDAGLSQAAAAGALSLSTLLGALANPGWGYLSDRHSPRKLAMIALVVTAAITSFFLVTDSGSRGFFVVVLWGTASGGLHVLSNMMISQYFGRASYGSITGLMGPIQLGFLGLGPTFGALLYGLTDGYTPFFTYSVSSYVLAILFIYSARPPRLPSRAQAESRSA